MTHTRICIIAALALVLGSIATYVFFSTEVQPQHVVAGSQYAGMDFAELSTHFEALAKEEGAITAFAELKNAELPENTDLHLLAHVVGDQLYLQEGVDGMEHCTHDFRNACSHTIVIGAMLEYGEGAIPLVRDACKKAPGGSGAYTMCFHGFGHGVFAFNGYDLEQTVAFCKRTGTEAYNHREYEECVGGAVMELMGGGGHDREAWLAARDEYLSSDNPFSVCTLPFMEDAVQPICYTYLSPHLFTFDGGSLGRPTDADFESAFAYCNTLPATQTLNRDACFGGIGKEFVGLVLGRDIRDVEALTHANYRTIHRLCQLAEPADGQEFCVRHVVKSLYWGGENHFRGPLNFCAAVDESRLADTCYDEIIGNVGYYMEEQAYREAFCHAVPDAYASACASRLIPESV